MSNHYSMLLEWSEEDHAFVVSFPEFPGAHTHGQSYMEAVQSGQDVLVLLTEAFTQEGRALPLPALYQYALA